MNHYWKNVVRIILCLVLFFVGAWVFNHGNPYIGILVAVVYPLLWVLVKMEKVFK